MPSYLWETSLASKTPDEHKAEYLPWLAGRRGGLDRVVLAGVEGLQEIATVLAESSGGRAGVRRYKLAGNGRAEHEDRCDLHCILGVDWEGLSQERVVSSARESLERQNQQVAGQLFDERACVVKRVWVITSGVEGQRRWGEKRADEFGWKERERETDCDSLLLYAAVAAV